MCTLLTALFLSLFFPSFAVLQSWVESANDPACDFPLDNLPYGIFSLPGSEKKRIGVAIGDQVFDVAGAAENGLLSLSNALLQALSQPALNALMGLGPDEWHMLRKELQAVLSQGSPPHKQLLFSQQAVEMHLPVKVGDYTDFYTSIDHARNVGTLFRPKNPLMPNFKHLPLAYNGRASSLQISGKEVMRPCGQIVEESRPLYGLCKRLDYEMELGIYIGQGNKQGKPIPMAEARRHLFGLTLLNDWSARDIQKWEMAPLGPFNGKNFATSLGVWVVTLEALEPYRTAGPARSEHDPEMLEYLKPVEDYVLDITVEVYLRSKNMQEQGKEPAFVSRGNFSAMYWTIAQMLVQHAASGCPLRPGDLFGSGTISGPDVSMRGCLLEHTLPDAGPILLPDGSVRCFLEDGDEVILKAYADKEGLPRIGFGVCCATVISPN